jgi:hypothetical protein
MKCNQKDQATMLLYGLPTMWVMLHLLHLLHLLQFTYGRRQLDPFSAVAFDADPLSFQDLLIHQLLAEAKELLMHGSGCTGLHLNLLGHR